DAIDLRERQLVCLAVGLVAVHALVIAAVGHLEGHGDGTVLAPCALGEDIGSAAVQLHEDRPGDGRAAVRGWRGSLRGSLHGPLARVTSVGRSRVAGPRASTQHPDAMRSA